MMVFRLTLHMSQGSNTHLILQIHPSHFLMNSIVGSLLLSHKSKSVERFYSSIFCRPVCHKYGNEGHCRFLFPHKIVEASYFDPDNNSIVLMCCDSTINYFNPYILVFCHHNHDLKCILSGRATKAASFYITDYMTKMCPTTYQMLSLLSKAISNMPQTNDCSDASKAKILSQTLFKFSTFSAIVKKI